MATFIVMAMRNLYRRKARFFLTTITLVIGITLFGGILITTDSFEATFVGNYNETLGTADILIKNNEVQNGWFDPGEINATLHNQDDLKAISFRISGFGVYVSGTDSGNQLEDSTRTNVYGINPYSTEEKEIGSKPYVLDSVIEGEYVEDFLKYTSPTTANRTLVITESLKIQLGKDFLVGDSVFIFPNEGDLTIGASLGDTGTWLEYSVVAIIRDIGEAKDFDVNTKESISPSQLQCLWTNIENTHELVDGNEDHTGKYNLIAIQTNDVDGIAEIEEDLKSTLNPDSSTSWVVLDIKTSGLQAMNDMIGMMLNIFLMFALIALILSLILIMNIFNIMKEEQEYEIGMLQTLGSSKNETFRLFLYQAFIIGVTGTLIGTLLSMVVAESILKFTVNQMAINSGTLTAGEYILVIKPITLMITFGVGITSCLLAALIPSYKASRKEIISCLNPRSKKSIDQKNQKAKNIKTAIISLSILLSGLLLIVFRSQITDWWVSLGAEDGITNSDVSINALIVIVAPTFILIGIVFGTSLVLPTVIRFFGVFFRPYLKKTSFLTEKSILRNKKRTTLTFFLITLTVAYLISISITIASFNTGMVSNLDNSMGTDIKLYTQNTPFGAKSAINDTDGVADVTGIGRTNALLKIENEWIGHTILDKNYSIEIDVKVLDSNYFKKIFSGQKFIDSKYTSQNLTIDELDKVDTPSMIITKDLSMDYNLSVGDSIPIQFNIDVQYANISMLFEQNTEDAGESIVERNVEIIGIAKTVPGFGNMFMMSSEMFTHGAVEYPIFISWNLYNELAKEELPGSGIDIIVRQDSNTGDPMRDSVLPAWFNITDVESILTSNILIDYYTTRMEYYTPSMVATNMDVQTSVVGLHTETFGNIKSDTFFGTHNITDSLPMYENNNTIEEILNGSSTMCVVDETYVLNQIANGNTGFGVGSTLSLFPQNRTMGQVFLDSTNTFPAVLNGTTLSGNANSLQYPDNNNFTIESNETNIEVLFNIYLDAARYTMPTAIIMENSVNASISQMNLEIFNYATQSYDTYGNLNYTDEDHPSVIPIYTPNLYVNISTGLMKLKLVGYNATVTNNYTLTIDQMMVSVIQTADSMTNPMTWPSYTVAAIIGDGNYYNSERYLWQKGYEIAVDAYGTQNSVYLNYEEARSSVFVDYKGSDIYNDNVTHFLIHVKDLDNVTICYDDLISDFMSQSTYSWSVANLKSIVYPIRTNVYEWFIWIETGQNDEEVLESVIDSLIDENFIVLASITKSYMSKNFSSIMDLLTFVIVGLLAFSIVVSMIGLVLHCLLTTMSRRREIGMLRSIGLNKGGIIRSVSGETQLISVISVILGLIYGIGIGTLIVINLPVTNLFDIVVTFPKDLISGLIGITLVTAFIGAMLPARWAANINIIDAVRTR